VASFDGNLTTVGDHENASVTNYYGSLNVSLTKSFLDDRLSVRLKGHDLLGTEKQRVMIFLDGTQFEQFGWGDSREFEITVRYKFNTTRSKYKGTGAGNEEKERL
jgi:hypothetical protein